MGLEVAAMGSVIGLEAARAAEARATSSGFFQDDMLVAQRARVERDVRVCVEREPDAADLEGDAALGNESETDPYDGERRRRRQQSAWGGAKRTSRLISLHAVL